MMGPFDMHTNPTLLQLKEVRLSQSFYSVTQYWQNVKKTKTLFTNLKEAIVKRPFKKYTCECMIYFGWKNESDHWNSIPEMARYEFIIKGIVRNICKALITYSSTYINNKYWNKSSYHVYTCGIEHWQYSL